MKQPVSRIQKVFCGRRKNIRIAFLLCFLFGVTSPVGAEPVLSDPDTVVHPAVDVLAEVEREPSAVPTPEGSILGVLIFLLCLGGAAAGLVWWKRQRVSLAGLSASAQNIHVETTRAIGPKQYLVVARVGRERFLVGTGPQGPQLVSRLEDVPETFSVPGGDASGREESI